MPGQQQFTKASEPEANYYCFNPQKAPVWRPGKRSLRAREIRAVKMDGRSRCNRWRVNSSGWNRGKTRFLTQEPSNILVQSIQDKEKN